MVFSSTRGLIWSDRKRLSPIYPGSKITYRFDKAHTFRAYVRCFVLCPADVIGFRTESWHTFTSAGFGAGLSSPTYRGNTDSRVLVYRVDDMVARLGKVADTYMVKKASRIRGR